ncbi:hypothetical protein HanPI659440_Chr13g0488131 [Helianthus annuus]|nr:hypothetical protein HanPI659440_Chr13g0488131 [Helianthus annuus]
MCRSLIHCGSGRDSKIARDNHKRLVLNNRLDPKGRGVPHCYNLPDLPRASTTTTPRSPFLKK